MAEEGMFDQQETPEKVLNKTSVYTVRDWKEYLGESALIIFSVLLALILTEYFNSLHEKENNKSILKSIVAELNQNKKAIQEMQQYNLTVLSKIDSELINKKLQNELVADDEFHLQAIAPQGVLYRYLDNNAWTIAKSNNISSKVDVETLAMINRVYEDQDRMMKLETEVAKIIFDRASRDPKQVHATLILIRDVYHGWAVDRADSLIRLIDQAIKKVETY